jgi:hypothetical protein
VLGNCLDEIDPGERITVEIEYHVERKIRNPIFGIDFYDPDGQLIGGLYNSYENIELPDIEGKGCKGYRRSFCPAVEQLPLRSEGI